MQYFATAVLSLALCTFASPVSAGVANGNDACYHVTFTIQLDDQSLANLQAAGIDAPDLQGSATYDPTNITGVGFDILDTTEGFNAFSFHITNRQNPAGGADLPDLHFDLADDTNTFGGPEAVFENGVIQGFNYEFVPGSTFGPEDVAFGQGQVRLGTGIIPGEGRGNLVFTDPTPCDSAPVPTPTAFAAGLLGLALASRRRSR